ncbi:MAG: DUF2326 domain-containing protein [Pseudomonadota bacterium]
MRLIKLSANKPGFKTVRFNKSGLSLIVGVRTLEPENADADGRSYNGVGKSLLVELIHFCLGSSTNSAFQQHLHDWEFSLEFEVADIHYVAIRQAAKQNEIVLNGKTYKVPAFNDYLEQITFDIPETSVGGLSFRVLLPRFIRRGFHDYNSPKTTSGDREPYTVLLRNLFLLGLDIGLVEKKCQLRRRQSELEAFEKNFKKDPFIREYYTGNKDATLQTKHLEIQIQQLESDLAKFKVAEDFYEIEQEANQLNKTLRELKNQKIVVENALNNIDKSLQTRADLSKDRIVELYEELLSAFKAETLKRLDDIDFFHKRLIENRFARLGQERMHLSSELQKISKQIKDMNNTLDEKLAYLSDKRALDQYVSVSSHRSDLLGKLQKLQDYQRLLQKSRDDLVHVKKDFNEETIKTNLYLTETQEELDKHIALFADLAKHFYPESPAGITLENNLGENKVRYDFDVRIEADGSDGINAVKIFCYDLAVLLMNNNHHMNFIWHDSRLFSDIDPRQRAVLFKVAHDFVTARGKQYIATVNQDQLKAMQSEFTEDEFQTLFEKEKIVLTLKDDGPNSKLLGMQVDMHYQ